MVSVTCLIKDQSEYTEINAAYIAHWESKGIPAVGCTAKSANGALSLSLLVLLMAPLV